MSVNLAAFLGMIAVSEGTARAPDPYRVCFGFKHTIADLSNHPAITGEWKGEPLDFLGPGYEGLISTAAGKYQITRHTWAALKTALNLLNFGPASQDAAATSLIRQKGALALVESGQIAAAIELCHPVWASLPGSSAGQPITPMASLLKAYADAGGAYA